MGYAESYVAAQRRAGLVPVFTNGKEKGFPVTYTFTPVEKCYRTGRTRDIMGEKVEIWQLIGLPDDVPGDPIPKNNPRFPND